MTTKEQTEEFFSDLERKKNKEKFREEIHNSAILTVLSALCDVNPQSRLDVSIDSSWSEYKKIFTEMMTPFTLSGVPYGDSRQDLEMGIVEIKHKKERYTERDARTTKEREDPDTLQIYVSILEELTEEIEDINPERIRQMPIDLTKENVSEYLDMNCKGSRKEKYNAGRLFDNLQDSVKRIDTKNEDLKRFTSR